MNTARKVMIHAAEYIVIVAQIFCLTIIKLRLNELKNPLCSKSKAGAVMENRIVNRIPGAMRNTYPKVLSSIAIRLAAVRGSIKINAIFILSLRVTTLPSRVLEVAIVMVPQLMLFVIA